MDERQSHKTYNMRKKYIKTAAVTVAFILINLAGRGLAGTLSLPLWLDSLGTLIAAYYLGPVSGAIVGAASDLIPGLSDITTAAFSLLSIVIGLSAGYAARKRVFESFFRSMTYASVLTLFTFTTASILDLVVADGSIDNIWGDAVRQFSLSIGVPKVIAIFFGQFYMEFADKISTVALFYLLLHAYRSFKRRSGGTKRRNQAGGVTAAVLLISILLPFTAVQSYAADSGSFVQNTYNEKNGFIPGHATSVATTRDGMLWIGTYAGLYSYDGNRFELFDAEQIKNVNCLYTDSEGRLWVGTNDSGLAIVIEGKLTNVIDEDGGLADNSVRSITQASDGSVYVGTSDIMQVVSLSNGLSVTDSITDICYADRSDSGENGLAACVTNEGSLFLMKDSAVIDRLSGSDETAFSCVHFADDGRIYAGTASGDVVILFVNGQQLERQDFIDTGIDSVANWFVADAGGSLLLICDNGMYRVSEENGTEKISTGDFTYSLQSAVYDYQGNLWIASTRQGLLEISSSAYTDLFTEYGLGQVIVNASLLQGNMLYVGCDDGLAVIDIVTGERIYNGLTDELAGTRVRSLASDKAGNIYAASYSKGLISQSAGGETEHYTDINSPGMKTRSVIVTSDDTVIAASDKGISFIKDGKAVSLIPYGDELGEVAVLSLCELGDGTIAAVTDGNGYFLTDNGIITGHVTKQDGLSSDVVMKAVPAVKQEDTFFLVTSNGLSVSEKGRVRALSEFPYSNNYDIVETSDGSCYVTGSAGIYVTTETDLLENDGREAVLSGAPEGLPYHLTANSNNISDGRYLYLCGSEGLVRADSKEIMNVNRMFLISVKSVSTAANSYSSDGDYDVTIPGDEGAITIVPEVINFALTDPVISYRLAGYETKWHVVPYSEISKLVYSGLPAGNYTFQIAAFGDEDQILGENSFAFTVSEQMYESGYFRAYLIIVMLLLISWITWFITHLFLVSRQEKTEAALRIARKQVEMGNESVLALTKALFSKDRRTGEHCHRVAYYAEKLAEAYGFSEKDTRNLKKAALLHDIGKIAVPDSVLNKPGKLTDEEYAVIKTHTSAGADILKGFTIVDHVSEGAKYHHERYDGRGYPEGLHGENIPLYGRIIALADSFDAMTANRVYRNALDMNQVMAEFRKGRGTQFDPYLDDLFMGLIEKGEIDPKKTFEMFRGRDLTEDIE